MLFVISCHRLISILKSNTQSVSALRLFSFLNIEAILIGLKTMSLKVQDTYIEGSYLEAF